MPCPIRPRVWRRNSIEIKSKNPTPLADHISFPYHAAKAKLGGRTPHSAALIAGSECQALGQDAHVHRRGVRHHRLVSYLLRRKPGHGLRHEAGQQALLDHLPNHCHGAVGMASDGDGTIVPCLQVRLLCRHLIHLCRRSGQSLGFDLLRATLQ